MVQICWLQQGFLVSRFSTCQCNIKARVRDSITLVSRLYYGRDCQWCQSTDLRAMFIRARIVTEPVKAILDRATLINTGIVKDYVRAYFHSRVYQSLCQNLTCWSHINQTGIVRWYHSHTSHSRVAMNTRLFCSTNLIRKITIISARSHMADTQAIPSCPQYVHIAIG